MKVTASQLRADIYNILDRSLATGAPVEVVRKGRVLKIVPEPAPGKLKRLKKRNCLAGDPEAIVHLDWLGEWSGAK